MNLLRTLLTALTLCALGLTSIAELHAEDKFGEKLKQELERSANTGPAGKGAFITEAKINEDCYASIVIGQKVDGKWKTANLFGYITIAPAGEYYVLEISCEQMKVRTKLDGPHAKFTIRPGELTNIGMLVIDYHRNDLLGLTGTARRSVQSLTQRAVKVLHEKYPEMMKKVVNRPMEVVGPPEISTKRKIGF